MQPKVGNVVRAFTEAGRGNPGVVETLHHVIEMTALSPGIPNMKGTAYRNTIATIRMLDGVVISADTRSLVAITPLEVLSDLPEPK
jgi:hypothetical protein